jgi:ureidoglycolate dehydrogenase (NAD+)
MLTFTPERLHDFLAASLTTAGLTGDEAARCAKAAVFADLRGADTHGVMYLLPRTLESLRAGKTVAGARPRLVRDAGATALLAANGLAGPVMGHRAMMMAIDKATRFGIGAVATRNGNPLGMLGYYPFLAVPRGLIGLAMANTAPAVAPFGSGAPVFGTNPVAYAAPARGQRAILFDMASSVAAAGKLIRARRRGQSLPEGWVIDPDGRPITDAAQASAGALLPFGGHKGSGIALLAHLLTGGLAGTTVGGEPTHDHPDPALRGQASVFMAIDPAFFGSREDFERLVDRQIEFIHAARPLPGVAAVLAPGERGWREADRRRREGIPIAEEDWATLRAALREAGLPEAELAARFGPTTPTAGAAS